MKLIKVKGIAKLEKKKMADVKGAMCRYLVGENRIYCKSFNIIILPATEYPDNLIREVQS